MKALYVLISMARAHGFSSKINRCGVASFRSLNRRRHAALRMIEEPTAERKELSLTESSARNTRSISLPLQGRRKMLANALVAGQLAMGIPRVACAYDKAYPLELEASDADGVLDSRQRKLDKVRQRTETKRSSTPIASSPVSTIVWASALWFLTGSRSNPLITPIANVVYDEDGNSWLKDRNEGLFSDIPTPLLALVALIFAALGFGIDSFVTLLTDGDRSLSLQLAGVSLITGGSLELGRIASGEKKSTRAESNRDSELEEEFQQFADARLKPGGNAHRNEIVQAFRRYYAKYRQSDNPDFPLSDLEIEQLVKNWSKQYGDVTMSSAGFYSGVSINQDADVFVQR